jgi:hypothetical protein
MKTLLLTLLLISGTLALSAADTAQPAAKPDPWKPLRLFVGEWEGVSEGQSGKGQARRDYRFVLGDRFLSVTNTVVYPPQEKNPKGETHHELGLYSYDRAAKKLMLRQFHVEGFVNQYALESTADDGRTLVFVTTSIESIPPGWRARETCRFVSDDEFIETFALAEPGKDFATYSELRFRRKK